MSRRRCEHSVSLSRPTPESHAWTFQEACSAAQREIEHLCGLDWKVVEIEFDDDGRVTSTDYNEGGEKTWKCVHTVVAMYVLEPKFASEAERETAMSREIIKSENTIVMKYNMINDAFEYND
ncbi:hypothetical protein PM10SUCC1_00110 [Propionigenium maris DSM 9537]|uniref:Uncharacterized protein n=1 Tax=Propionigenium maris DSM 9537 TaxID=1123000 RepID=A0A9W6LKQ6_9FUSO|nr:hypothetical protein [Propionigenium maris]GLI54496.1 hypothetical protein PM10SUCC1_00110 [Propionigenium maris DSM 9537]